MAAAAAVSRPKRQVAFDFTPVPEGFFEKVLGSVSPACAVLCGLVLERTIGKRRRPGSPAPEWYSPTEAELAEVMRMSERNVRNLIREASTCIKSSEDSPLGILEIRGQIGKKIEIRFAIENLQRLKPIRELRVLPNKAEREEKKRQVQARKAQMTCPAGLQCPVDEVYLDQTVTNIAPADAEIVRFPPSDPGTQLPGSEVHEQPKPRNSSSGVVPINPGTQVPGSDTITELRSGLIPLIKHRLAVMPDDSFLKRVAAELNGTPREQFFAAIEDKTDAAWRKHGKKLLLCAATDARRTHEQLQAIPESIDDLVRAMYRAQGAQANKEAAKRLLQHPHCPPSERDVILQTFPELA